MTNLQLQTWKVSDRAAGKIRGGYPWIFANELAHSPKGTNPGSLVEVVDRRGQLLGTAYANPHSLIAGRIVERGRTLLSIDMEWLAAKLVHAAKLRRYLGRLGSSFRLIHSENDGLPGLVIDCFRNEHFAVFAIEVNTAGAEALFAPHLQPALEQLVQALESMCPDFPKWASCSVIQHQDSRFRTQEGLEQQPLQIIKQSTDVTLDDFAITLPALNGSTSLRADLLGGQKTGFFLDQADNILAFLQILQRRQPDRNKVIRMVDLCCYVGQWSVQVADLAQKMGLRVELTLVDDSRTALDRAKTNLMRFDFPVHDIKANVLRDLRGNFDRPFDVVICDPPAFVKGRKDKPQALQAYQRLNGDAMQLVAPDGLYVSCSCSGLVTDEEFTEMLGNAVGRSNVPMAWIARGGQAGDHPIRLEFPEGTYLKCWIGQRH